MRRTVSGSRRGFSLFELALVTGLFVLLVVIMLPMTRARETCGLRITCRGNLRQLGTALLMYAQDYDQMLPPHATVCGTVVTPLPDLLYPYTKDAYFFRCPNHPGFKGYSSPPEDSPISVGYNWLALSPMGRPISLDEVGNPADTVALTDASGYIATPSSLVEAFGGTPPAYRHQGQANVTWLDGHVKLQGPQELERSSLIESGRLLHSGIDSYLHWNVDPAQSGDNKAGVR